MTIDYKKWRREVWELTNHEKLKLAPIFELESIEIKLRRMICDYENDVIKHYGSTMKFDSKQSQ